MTGFQAAALYHRAKILRIMGELDSAEEEVRRALGLYASMNDLAGRAQSLLVLGRSFLIRQGSNKWSRSAGKLPC